MSPGSVRAGRRGQPAAARTAMPRTQRAAVPACRDGPGAARAISPSGPGALAPSRRARGRGVRRARRGPMRPWRRPAPGRPRPPGSCCAAAATRAQCVGGVPGDGPVDRDDERGEIAGGLRTATRPRSARSGAWRGPRRPRPARGGAAGRYAPGTTPRVRVGRAQEGGAPSGVPGEHERGGAGRRRVVPPRRAGGRGRRTAGSRRCRAGPPGCGRRGLRARRSPVRRRAVLPGGAGP